jgi:hypothetical protein
MNGIIDAPPPPNPPQSVNNSVNPYTNKAYSSKYLEILSKRKILPV